MNTTLHAVEAWPNRKEIRNHFLPADRLTRALGRHRAHADRPTAPPPEGSNSLLPLLIPI